MTEVPNTKKRRVPEGATQVEFYLKLHPYETTLDVDTGDQPPTVASGINVSVSHQPEHIIREWAEMDWQQEAFDWFLDVTKDYIEIAVLYKDADGNYLDTEEDDT